MNRKNKSERCSRCGRMDAYTMGGRSLCADCCEKQAEYWSQHPEFNERQKERGKARYRQRKECGLCTRCGKRPAATRKAKCVYCLKKDANAHKKSSAASGTLSRELARDLGICVTCLKKPVIVGQFLCSDCYEKSVRSIAYARSCIKNRTGIIFGKGVRQCSRT